MNSQLTQDFLNCFAKLPDSVKEQARRCYQMWRDNPAHPSLHFKQIHGQENVYSVRVGMGWRALSLRDGNTLPAVRILPMDSQLEFDGRSIEEVQQTFFLKELLGSGRPPGKYWYRESGLNADSGTTVLFQYEGRLIASATLIEVERFETPETGTYRGALYFDVNSIRVFNPIGPEVVARIWPEFKRFSHVKQKLAPKGLAEFERNLRGVEKPKL